MFLQKYGKNHLSPKRLVIFCKKRIPHMLFPFLIWSVICYLTPRFTGLLGMDSSVVYKLFS